MIEQFAVCTSEVTRVAREVGTEGKLGGQAQVPGVAGTWKDLTDNVNFMAANLTEQVRGIVKVVTAVANGNLAQRLTVQAKGEVAALADTINGMTDTLAIFADQVTNVAREVGVDGRLGGQANVPGAAGTWKDLTGNVNLLAANLTTQVRAIAEVATAVTKGDLTRSIQVDAKTVGQMLLSALAPLVNAHQGTVYHYGGNADEQSLALLSSYAQAGSVVLAKTIRLGEGLVELARPLIHALRHELVVAAPEGKLLLHADRPRLTQALTNLLNNAAKYMDAGGRIALVVQERGHELRVTVADRGIGIAEDRLPHVFEMFSQVESALARSRGGLGIGLSLTQRLVELHGGSVVARSPGLGKGSEFEVILPRALPETAAEAAGARPHAADGATHRPLRILVADDKQDAAATLSMLLEALGHTVACVYDGLAAVQAAREIQPDIALLDIGMPELNGYETCRQIRALPGGAAVYLVAITGWGQPEDRRLSDQAGFDRHLVKPVDADAIEDVLTHVGRKLGNPTAIYANK